MAEEGRKIGVAMDFSKGSKAALKWAIDGFLKKGDTLYVIHVKLRQTLESRNLVWSDTGAPLIPYVELRDPAVMHGYGTEFDPEVLELLETITKQCEATVIGKIYWGDAREKVCEAVEPMQLDTDHGKQGPWFPPEGTARERNQLRARACSLSCDSRQGLTA